jgi:hypothetical protein
MDEGKLTGRGGPGRGQGRKPLAGGPLIPVSIKMTSEQRDKLLRLGGAPWVRRKIQTAKDPNKHAAPQSDT